MAPQTEKLVPSVSRPYKLGYTYIARDLPSIDMEPQITSVP